MKNFIQKILMKKLVIAFAVAGASLIYSGEAFAQRGGNVSGGADSYEDTLAWFTSSDLASVVHACVQTTPEFGFTTAQLKAMTQNAFQKWVTYYLKTGSASRDSNPANWDQCPMDRVRVGYRIATHLEVSETCSGSEDLVINFGIENADIDARKLKHTFPFAFADIFQAPSVGVLQGAWSKGMIWIAPPGTVNPSFGEPLWTNYEGAPLEMALLHEMGHVFGTEHIDGTVMRGDIGIELAKVTDKRYAGTKHSQFNPLLLNIDVQNFLVFNPEGEMNYPFSPPSTPCLEDDDQCHESSKPTFQAVYGLLTGMDMRGSYFSSQFTKVKSTDRNAVEAGAVAKYLSSTFSLDAGGFNQTFSFIPSVMTSYEPSGKSFNRGCKFEQHAAYSFSGTLVKPDGSKIPMNMNVNSPEFLVEFVDPLYNPSKYCDFYNRQERPCTLLGVNYSELRERMSNLSPSSSAFLY